MSAPDDHDSALDDDLDGAALCESDELPPARVRLVRDSDDDEAWRDKLILSEKTVGRGANKQTYYVVVPTLANIVTMLTEHPGWRGILGYNAFAERIEVLSSPPWHEAERPADVGPGEWRESDTPRTVAWFERSERLRVGERTVESAFPIVAERNIFHPVRDYLRSLRWDAKQRLPDVLATHFGCASTEYTRAIGVRWFISAVARVMVPGCQADCTLVVESPKQGWYKTSAFRELVPVRNWYSDTGVEIGNKDSMQALHGVWIYGLDELDSLSRSEITRTKTFLTQTVDRFRPPFGKRPRDFPRQNVFVGSTNQSEYLSDSTGNRRFWPARLLRPIDVETIRRDRDQLWAEAVARFDSGEKWHVDTPGLRVLCEAEQAERVTDDTWLPIIAEWLTSPSVTMPDPVDGKLRTESLDIAAGVTTTDVLLGALRMKPADMTKADAMRAAEVLRQLQFTDVERVRENGGRVRRYRKAAA